jgi:hypothetical protein
LVAEVEHLPTFTNSKEYATVKFFKEDSQSAEVIGKTETERALAPCFLAYC